MFDYSFELANNHFHPFDPTGRVNDTYDGWGASNSGANPRKTARNHDNYRNFNSGGGGGVQFRAHDAAEEDESGVCSPPLWKTSPSRATSMLNNPQSRQSSYRHLSPNSRTQAIARGQRELMEMVKNMPEASYELSLKDIVEQTRAGNQEERSSGHERSGRRGGVKRQESKKSETKTKVGGAENRGLLLNMVFPFSLGSSKKKKNLATKVSPKPSEGNNATSNFIGVDKEWWKKRFSGSGGSESSGTSSNSGSTRSSGSSGSSNSSRSNSCRNNSGLIPGCWSFFHRKKSKYAK